MAPQPACSLNLSLNTAWQSLRAPAAGGRLRCARCRRFRVRAASKHQSAVLLRRSSPPLALAPGADVAASLRGRRCARGTSLTPDTPLGRF